MTCLLSRSTLALAITLFITAPLALRVGAQNPTPSAAVSLMRIPQLTRSTFPGDFNRDNRTDLIAGGQTTSGAPSLVLATGAGNGTFAAPRALGIAAEPAAVSDINADGRLDVIVGTSSGVSVLPGNGDGTFGTLRPIATAGEVTAFLAVADFNGDSHRDVVLGATDAAGNPGMAIYPGRRDFTFGPRMLLPRMPDGPTSAISGDFNGDGRRDLAATTVCCSLWVFINNGGFLFAASEIVMNRDLADITTGDLNGDNRLDLVVTESFPDSGTLSNPGLVAVLLGNGDGTFDPKVEYDTRMKGEYTVVVGDFTRDGILDVATGNLSAYYDDDFGYQMWDSISILKGTGTGALTAPVTFALGTVNGEETYRNTHHQLNTNDLDADGHTDLIGSPGAILLNRVPVANRPPAAFAGPDRSYSTEDPIVLSGEASDPDGHWVTYTWRNEDGAVVRRAPMAAPVGLITGAQPGTYTYTLTAEDGQGGVATDSVVVTVGNSFRRVVDLRKPVFGERVFVGRPYTITWDADDATFMILRFDVSYSLDGGRTFQTIEECNGLNRFARQCVWQRPGPRSATALVRIMATYNGHPHGSTSPTGSRWSTRRTACCRQAGAAATSARSVQPAAPRSMARRSA